ncbi:MAG: glucose-6-phosphate dehydrogenase [gamma proteobacterium symbiont of Ctena orbiculata]|nr:MAG: glucose-6-phosphate dehydrogenase [gamma proteobacterium symbiont of Ctena orbiculata]PVV23562.1 MAG: glucose-6-phosphate dehydrogenase [gamma proteobacterium symbiont of Ctena orbiculata]
MRVTDLSPHQRIDASELFLQADRLEPCVLVIFGAAGDLTRRKLIPALYNMVREEALDERFAVIGYSRSPQSDDQYRDLLLDGLGNYSRAQPIDEKLWQGFSQRISYVEGNFEDPEGYAALRNGLEAVERLIGSDGNRLFYLATPPSAAPIILHRLSEAGLLQAGGADSPWTRIILEKPYGRDLESASDLNRIVAEVLQEDQVYRIDHYLGKETVQNILVARLGNTIFEPLWNRKYIDHVQITAAESIGVEGRGRFYDRTGVVRDMVQSHLLQVLSLCAMEPPVSFAADDIRDKRVEVLRSLRQFTAEEVFKNVVFGQYRGYRDEENVDRESRTPTYAAIMCFIDNWRWQGVPFFLRVGKHLSQRLTEISVVFRPVPLCLFGRDDVCQDLEPNVLTIRIQPDAGMALKISSKRPGGEMEVASVEMDFSYSETYAHPIRDAYERLLLDAVKGDATLFARRDEVEFAWRFVTPILSSWEGAIKRQPVFYAEGSEGPVEAENLMHGQGRQWREIC